MLLILFKNLLKAQQLGLFASPTLVAPHVRKDGTLVNAHIRVVKKRPAAPIKARITSAPRPHTPDLFAAHDEPVVIGQTRDLFDAAPAPRAAQADLFAPTVEATETKTPEVKTPAPAPTAPDDVKWFGSQEKADAWIGKKKLSDTHEVVAVGRRFEIHPRATAKESSVVAPVVNSQMTTEPVGKHQPGINYDGLFSPSSVAPFGVSAGVTKGERIRINGEARTLINRGGPFSDDERATLSQYSGNGRGLRQGNISEAVRIHTYLSKGSFDGYKYQTVASKRDWQGDLWNGGNTIANHNRPDNLAREDMLIMLAADPDEARKQFAENKSAALERQGSEKRREVAVQFTRLQGLKRSYSKLAGKGGRSAIKLAAEIEKAQNNLASSKWFTAKSLLTSDAPAVVHPDTGSGITLDTVLHLGPKSKISEGGAWVVTGVNPEDGRLRLRHYAGTRSMNVELADVGSDMTTSTLDHSVEATEMARRAEETVSFGENAITSPAQVSQLPADTVKKLYPQIQAQLKEARKAYKMPSDFQNGRIGLLGADGVPKVVQYFHDKGEDDYLLATDEHRAKVLDAYVGAERGKKFSMDWQSNGRKNSSGGTYVFRQKYDGGWDWYTNPWGEVGKKLFGSEFEAEAMRRVAQSAITDGRHAKKLSEAYDALKPLAQVAGYGTPKVTMPKRAIATLYAQAKRSDMLDQLSKFATGANQKADHQILNADLPLISSLIERASVSGHQDLAAAMVLDHWKDQPRKALEMLATVSEQQHDSRYSGTTTVVAKQAKQAIRVLVQNNPELGALKIDELPWALKHIYPARAGTLGEALQENAA